MELPSYHRSYTQRRGGRPSRCKPGSRSLRRPAQAGRIHTGRRASHQVVANANRVSPEKHCPAEVEAGRVENAEPVSMGRRSKSSVKHWAHATDGVSGVIEDDMMTKSRQRKLGTTRGQPRRTRTAKASRISRQAVKSRCAREWGAWGRLSVDGPGHYNPDRSEGPWGRATSRCSNGGAPPVRPSGTERNTVSHPRSMTRRARRAHTNRRSDGYAGCRLNRSVDWEGTA